MIARPKLIIKQQYRLIKLTSRLVTVDPNHCIAGVIDELSSSAACEEGEKGFAGN